MVWGSQLGHLQGDRVSEPKAPQMRPQLPREEGPRDGGSVGRGLPGRDTVTRTFHPQRAWSRGQVEKHKNPAKEKDF